MYQRCRVRPPRQVGVNRRRRRAVLLMSSLRLGIVALGCLVASLVFCAPAAAMVIDQPVISPTSGTPGANVLVADCQTFTAAVWNRGELLEQGQVSGGGRDQIDLAVPV